MEATLGSLGSSGLHPYSTQTPAGRWGWAFSHSKNLIFVTRCGDEGLGDCDPKRGDRERRSGRGNRADSGEEPLVVPLCCARNSRKNYARFTWPIKAAA